MERLIYTVDLTGTLLFALEGAMAAIQGQLDLFGLIVVAYATAVGGGILRDLLIGAVPPQAIREWRYAAIAFAGAGAVFFWYGLVKQVPTWVMTVLDAGGLALFSVSGAGKALEYGINPFLAVLLGTLTGVGGGTIRDVLLAEVPKVLRADIYAVAAMAGAAVMVIGMRFGSSPAWTAVIGGLVCFVLRVVSVWEHWNLPKVIG